MSRTSNSEHSEHPPPYERKEASIIPRQESPEDLSRPFLKVEIDQSPLNVENISRPTSPKSSPEIYLASLLSNVTPRELSTIVAKPDPFHKSVLKCLMEKFQFKGAPIDIALRTFLYNFTLPVEGQQIERVLSAFANKYHGDNPQLFKSPSSIHVLAVALVMLNTDMYNASQKRKMTLAQFIKNTRGALEDEYFIPDIFFTVMFENIKACEFMYQNTPTNFSSVGWVIKQPPSFVDSKSPIQASIDRSISSEYPLYVSPQNSPTKSKSASNSTTRLDRKSEFVNILSRMTWEGPLARKDLKGALGLRGWRNCWTLLSGEEVYFFKDVEWFSLRSHLSLAEKLDPVKGSEGMRFK